MEDWSGGISCVYPANTGGDAMAKSPSFKFFVGIDVSKEKFDVCCIDSTGKKLFGLSTSMNRTGFEGLAMKLSSVSGSKDFVLIGMESTACYHIPLFSFLASLGYAVVIINPLLISNFMKLQLRKTKTDKKDAVVIAQYIFEKKDTLSQSALSSDITDLRDLARQRESLVDQMTAIKVDIKRLLSVIFPELERITCIFTKSMLRLLCQYPSAYAVRNAKRSRIVKLLIPGSYGKQTDESVDKIRKAAATSIGTASATKEIVLKQKGAILIQLEEHLQELTEMLIELCQLRMQEDIDILTSMRGIGNKSATNFLVELGGGIELYKSHKQVIAMAGLDPSVYQSGKHEGKGKISKRGNRHLRRIIWLMSTKVIIFNDFFKAYFLKRKKDGLPYKMAVLATAHKLIRIIFAMLSNKTFIRYVIKQNFSQYSSKLMIVDCTLVF
jgi:transposase